MYSKNNRMKIKVLLVSNQKPNKDGIGNPIMVRMKCALDGNRRIENVEFLPFSNSICSLLQIRRKAEKFDVIHVHFGGLYALVVWLILVGLDKQKIITFHGTDIHAKSLKTAKTIKKKLKIKLNQYASFLCIRLYDRCGMVAKEMMQYVPSKLKSIYKEKFFIQQLGVDYGTFIPSSTLEAQQMLALKTGHYVLFSDVANTPIKRRDIAEAIVQKIGHGYKLLVMCGVKPNMVPVYINAVDFVLLTSDEEGSPNIIREALALNKRVYSVEVGDAPKQLEGLKNSLIVSRDPQSAASAILKNLKVAYIDNTRIKLQKFLDFKYINDKVIDLYENS